VNRVILMTDGDFNVGITEPNDLDRLIQEKAKSGVFLSVLGVGRDNLKDDRMERLADKGHGNYAYIDSLKEARKVLVDQMSSTLVTIAKDVKLQVEFNPKEVEAFRQIGYENREMPHQDFNNDAKDAGDVGAGHSLTVLYEVLPKNAPALAMDNSLRPVDPLKYQQQGGVTQKAEREKDLSLTEAANSGEMLTVKIRYKEPEGKESALLEFPLKDRGLAYAKASEDFKFSAAVAAFGMILRGSQYKGTASFDSVLELGEEAKGKDPFGYRREFLDLVAKARALAKK
jgi:secreted protein with Ig-like and vWFA domain